MVNQIIVLGALLVFVVIPASFLLPGWLYIAVSGIAGWYSKPIANWLENEGVL